MKAKDQIAYVPDHAEGDVDHRDVQYGFVMSITDDGAFCRYWIRNQKGILRTVSCSELTPVRCLVHHNSVPQRVVDTWYEEIRNNPKTYGETRK